MLNGVETCAGLAALRARLERLFFLDAGAQPPQWLDDEARAQARALLDQDLPEVLGPLAPSSRARVADRLASLLESWYGAGTLAERRPLFDPLRAGEASPAREGGSAPSGVQLVWAGRGELLVEEDPRRPVFLHPGLGAAFTAAVEQAVGALCAERLVAEGRVGARKHGRAAAGWNQLHAEGSTLAHLGAELARLLDQIEQRRLAWRATPPNVVEVRWCVCVGRLPEALWSDLLRVPALRDEWRELFGIEVPSSEEGEALDAPAEAAHAFLRAHPTLVVDSALLPEALRARLFEAMGDLEQAGDGVLVEGDNAQALALLRERFAGRVQCAYLDPPFNTASGGFAYADRLSSAAWLCALDERVQAVRALLSEDGTLYAHIDGHEKERLKLLLDEHLYYVAEVIWRIGWVSGYKARANKFIRNHDTIYQYGRSPKPLFRKQYLPYPEGYLRRDGKPPRGQGLPLEDTWNCSSGDRLDSIQIKSFSREKVGRGDMTQKNEALLERMLEASSRPGDWVLDPYAGTGTTCATAQKMARRWIAIERMEAARTVILPRLKRVLFGDPYGISRARTWTGGGAFQFLRLEPAHVARRPASEEVCPS